MQRKINITLSIILIILVVIAGVTVLRYPDRMGLSSDTQSPPVAQNLYTCPMHPQVIQDTPGQCPICGMDLVPMEFEDGKEHDHGNPEQEDALDDVSYKGITVSLEPSMIQRMGVRTAPVKIEKISRIIRVPAHIDFNEKEVAIVNTRVTGWVERLYATYTGQSVRKGEALLEIYSPELVATQEEYLQLFEKYKAGERHPELIRLLESARKRLSYWNISRAQVSRIEKTGKAERTMSLFSPYSGVIVEKNVLEGAKIQEGSDLFKIANLSTIWAYVHIPEKDMPFIKQGMRAVMEVTQLPGETFSGKVSFIFPYMDPDSRDLKIRVTFSNSGRRLRPGMYATIILNSDLAGEHLTAPLSSVIHTGEREIVFVHNGNGVFEPREVHTGIATGDDRVQIIDGLVRGEAVVVSGQFLLDSETRIQEAVRKLRRDVGAPSGIGVPGGHSH